VNLQSIERLQNLLGRIQQNVKLPRTRTGGLGAFIVTPTSAAPALTLAQPAAPVVLPEPENVLLEQTKVSAAIAAKSAPEEEIQVDVEVPSLEALDAGDDGAALENAALENAALENAIEDVDLEDIAVEVVSAVTTEAPSEPALERQVAVMPFSVPPALDELTFSEPPPAPEPPAAVVEPRPIPVAQVVSEAPGSIDAALLAATEAHAAAAEPADAERAEAVPAESYRGPAFTPPPESGPQLTVPPMAAPAVPADYRGPAPTIEQLGELIELEQTLGPPLELAQPASEPVPALAKPPEELEFVPRASVPSRPLEAREPMQTLVGGFTEEEVVTGDATGPETPPPPARVFLRPAEVPAAVDVVAQQLESRQSTPTSVTTTDESAFGEESPTASSELAPELVARPPVALARPVVDVISAARAYRPASFLELLDASVGLLKK